MENAITRIRKFFGSGVEMLKKVVESKPELTYLISEDGRSIKCLQCGRTSYNKNDIERKFCGLCGYHDRIEPQT